MADRDQTAPAQVGVVGLAVMGSNLTRHGHTVALYNRTQARTDALVAAHGAEGTFVSAASVQEFAASLERPRRILVMVKAGPPTDATGPSRRFDRRGTRKCGCGPVPDPGLVVGVGAQVVAAAVVREVTPSGPRGRRRPADPDAGLAELAATVPPGAEGVEDLNAWRSTECRMADLHRDGQASKEEMP